MYLSFIEQKLLKLLCKKENENKMWEIEENILLKLYLIQD